jgi:hypothetical protein
MKFMCLRCGKVFQPDGSAKILQCPACGEKMKIQSLYTLTHKIGVGEKMAKKWYEMAQRSLDEGDEIIKSHTGVLDHQHGHLIMSERRILFMEEEGTFRKKYRVTLDLPYERLAKVTHINNSEIDLVDDEGNEHFFKPSSSWVNIEILEDEIRKFSETD